MERAARHFAQCLAQASSALERRPLSDGAVHAARKALKKARAALRLLRPAIGKAAFRRRNTRLRDAGRYLAPPRHAATLLEAVEALGKKHPEQFRDSTDAALAGRLVRRLHAKRERLRRELSGSPALDEWLRTLERLRNRAAAPQGVGDEPAALRQGLRRIYRTGRSAFAEARSKPGDEALHEWRKQVKYLANAFHILGPGGAKAAAAAARAEKLAGQLGEHHDLSELAPLLPSKSALRKQLDEQRQRIAQRSLKSGQALYREKPRHFARWLR